MSVSGGSVLMAPRQSPLILASGSRFRRAMLEHAGLAFEVEVATVNEPAERARMEAEHPGIAPGAVAMGLAEIKAMQVSAARPQALVVGADQVLALEGRIFGKPLDLTQARVQLMSLRGRVHTLPTAVVLAESGRVVWRHLGTATLHMRAFSEGFLDHYLRAAGDVVTETVGGYALEGLGSQLFERIEGDYFTIIGLPLLPLLDELRQRSVLAT